MFNRKPQKKPNYNNYNWNNTNQNQNQQQQFTSRIF